MLRENGSIHAWDDVSKVMRRRCDEVELCSFKILIRKSRQDDLFAELRSTMFSITSVRLNFRAGA
jgi:hypothetical protein